MLEFAWTPRVRQYGSPLDLLSGVPPCHPPQFPLPLIHPSRLICSLISMTNDWVHHSVHLHPLHHPPFQNFLLELWRIKCCFLVHHRCQQIQAHFYSLSCWPSSSWAFIRLHFWLVWHQVKTFDFVLIEQHNLDFFILYDEWPFCFYQFHFYGTNHLIQSYLQIPALTRCRRDHLSFQSGVMGQSPISDVSWPVRSLTTFLKYFEYSFKFDLL